jgi:hypothetical protein
MSTNHLVMGHRIEALRGGTDIQLEPTLACSCDAVRRGVVDSGPGFRPGES